MHSPEFLSDDNYDDDDDNYDDDDDNIDKTTKTFITKTTITKSATKKMTLTKMKITTRTQTKTTTRKLKFCVCFLRIYLGYFWYGCYYPYTSSLVKFFLINNIHVLSTSFNIINCSSVLFPTYNLLCSMLLHSLFLLFTLSKSFKIL